MDACSTGPKAKVPLREAEISRKAFPPPLLESQQPPRHLPHHPRQLPLRNHRPVLNIPARLHEHEPRAHRQRPPTAIKETTKLESQLQLDQRDLLLHLAHGDIAVEKAQVREEGCLCPGFRVRAGELWNGLLAEGGGEVEEVGRLGGAEGDLFEERGVCFEGFELDDDFVFLFLEFSREGEVVEPGFGGGLGVSFRGVDVGG